jgi:signal transduction histidine kinase
MVSGASHSLSTDRSPRQAERKIAHQLALLTKNVLGCSRVAILAVEPETEALRAVAVVGLEMDQEAQWWAEQRESEAKGARLGDGADPEAMRRIHAGEPVVIDMTQPPYCDLPNPRGISTTLIAPMRSGGKVVGLLILDFGGPLHAFTADESALSSVVAQLGAVALERDRLLHERAQAEAHIIALQDTQTRLDTFIGIAGHELKTPLTTALAMGQLAKRRIQTLTADIHRLDDEHVRRMEPVAVHLMRMVDQIGVANRRQARLVDDLLDVTRIQSGRLTFARTPCDLRQVVESAVEEARIQTPARPITLRLPRKKALVYADADRISQVMTNLLTNALKYSAPETSIEVQMRIQKGSQGEVATVRVRDEGVGIPLAEQGDVWTRFHRIPGIHVQSGTGVGLGLGLYITREIVERHGGQVGLSSEPGVGSTFWFSLPLASDEAAEASAESWDEDAQEPSTTNG